MKQLNGYCVNHPDRPAVVGCLLCGDFLCTECQQAGADKVCERCLRETQRTTVASRWEERPTPGGFFSVLGSLASGVGDFFSGVPHGKGGWQTFLFAGLALLSGAILSVGVIYLIGPASSETSAQLLWQKQLWLTPLNLLGLLPLLLFDALICFGLARLYDKTITLSRLLRLVSYSAAAWLLYAIPTLGMLLALLLGSFFLFTGAKRALGLTTFQALTLPLLPIAIKAGIVFLIRGGLGL
ncbi:YIP1 family protein [bacterium]|nr:YIP1 family protein [bacterium]